MEKNDGENYENLLIDINEIFIQSNKINNLEERFEVLKQNESKFVMLKNNLEEIAEKYLIKQYNDAIQNKKANILKNIIIEILRNDTVIDIQKEYDDYRVLMINMLSHYENRLMFRLRRSNDFKLIYECLEYQKDREAYIRAIKNNRIIDSNYLTERAIRNYTNDSYEKVMFENMIRIVKDDNIIINKRESKKLIKQIDSLEFLAKILNKREDKLKAVEKWMLQKYADTIIPLKATIHPESLEKDTLVIAFLDGKIKSEKLYLQIANAIPIEEFESLIFTINLKNTSRIIREIKLGNLSEKEKKEINELLEKAGIRINKREEKIEDDENFLVTIQELKEYYDKISTEELYDEKAKFYKANLNEKKGNKEINSSERKTYKEISIIIKMMTKKNRNKISPKFIEFIERNKSKSKTTEIDKNKKLKGQRIRHQTQVLLALIYRDYMCSEEERKQLIKEERAKMAKKDKEQTEQGLILKENLNWYQKLIKIIKDLIIKK